MSHPSSNPPKSSFTATGPLEPGLETFRYGWAFYVLATVLSEHFLWLGPQRTALLARYGLLFILALGVMARPASHWLVIALNMVLAGGYLAEMPVLTNHGMLTLIAALTLLGLDLPHALAGRASPARFPRSLWQQTRTLLGFELILMYFLVVLHKLNRDFFDVQHSCVVAMARELAESWALPWPEAPGWGQTLILLTLLIEALIPVLLLIPALRLPGLLIGFAFHAVLMLHPNPYIMGYSTLMYVMYLTFLPEPVTARVAVFWKSHKRTMLWFFLGALGLYVITTAVMAGMSHRLDGRGLLKAHHKAARIGLSVGWMLSHAFFAWTIVRAFRHTPMAAAGDCQSFFRPLAHPASLLIAVMLANGLAPYLGLYSARTWSMFSNLKVENGQSNHLLIPASSQIFPYLRETRLVLDSSDWQTHWAGTRGYQIPLVELRRRLSIDPDPARYVIMARPGEPFRRISYEEEPEHEVFQRLPFWIEKIFLCRAVSAGNAPCPCEW